MSKEDVIEATGIVEECLKDTKFRVKLDMPDGSGSEHVIIAHPAGKIRKNFIRIIEGDRVKVEMSPYDLTKGRITFRQR
jgi:translation initiation factor IF-1